MDQADKVILSPAEAGLTFLPANEVSWEGERPGTGKSALGQAGSRLTQRDRVLLRGRWRRARWHRAPHQRSRARAECRPRHRACAQRRRLGQRVPAEHCSAGWTYQLSPLRSPVGRQAARTACRGRLRRGGFTGRECLRVPGIVRHRRVCPGSAGLLRRRRVRGSAARGRAFQRRLACGWCPAATACQAGMGQVSLRGHRGHSYPGQIRPGLEDHVTGPPHGVELAVELVQARPRSCTKRQPSAPAGPHRTPRQSLRPAHNR